MIQSVGRQRDNQLNLHSLNYKTYLNKKQRNAIVQFSLKIISEWMNVLDCISLVISFLFLFFLFFSQYVFLGTSKNITKIVRTFELECQTTIRTTDTSSLIHPRS